MRFVFLTAQRFQFFDDRPHQADLEDVRVVQFGRGDTLQARTMIDVRFFKFFKLTIADFLICHEDVVADFHETATITVRVAMLTEFRIVWDIEFVKHLAVRATRVTDRRVRFVTVTAPPVLTAVVIKDSLAVFHATFIAGFFRTYVRLADTQSFGFEQSRPYIRCFGVFVYTELRCTAVASHVHPAHVELHHVA